MYLKSCLFQANRSKGRKLKRKPWLRPSNVLDLLIVSDQLGFDDAFFDIPDGAGGVDDGGTESLGYDFIPVEGGQRSVELTALAVVKDGERLKLKNPGTQFSGQFSDKLSC
ncbi:hypothetical protein Q3G72_009136 [Acer saccharum]|nr:hypothetical protein Q3G72_009136 [Acer saccharum]